MRKISIIALVLVALAIVACVAPPRPPAVSAPTTTPPAPASRTPPTPATPAPKPTATLTSVSVHLQYDWTAVYMRVVGGELQVWGLFGPYDGPDTPDQPDCPKDEVAGKAQLCQLDNIRRDGVLDPRTVDNLPICRVGKITQATPFPMPPSGIQAMRGLFYGMYQCRDAKSAEIITYGTTIDRKIWGGGQSCPREGNFEGRGPYILRLCYPMILVNPTPTPAVTPTPTKRPVI